MVTVPRRLVSRSRVALQAVAACALGIVALSCGREPTGIGGTGRASLVLSPAFQVTTAQGDDEVTSVRLTIYVVNPAAAAGTAGRRRELRSYKLDQASPGVVDTDDQLAITIEFPLQGEGSAYEVEGGAYNDGGILLYSVPVVSFTEKQVLAGGTISLSTTAVYVGPGANAVRILAAPRTLALAPGQSGSFTATVTGPNNAVIPVAVLRWSSLNPSVASVQNDRTGAVQANTVGSGKIVVNVEGTNVRDTVTVVVTAPTPTAITLASGGGQTGAAGLTLSSPIVVRVVSGSNPVPGVQVTFSVAGTAGGSVGTASAVTNSAGNAQTTWTLGSTVGAQTLTVSSSGVVSLSVGATATSNTNTVSFVSLTPSALSPGGTSTVLVQVRNPQGANAVGASVSFTASGSGISFSPATATTNTAGQATTVLSAATAGTFTLTASVTGNSAQTTMTVATNNSAVATQLVKISGDNQTVRIGQAFGAPIVVEARNAAGQPVAGAFVDFGTSTGTARQVTGADGRASVSYSVSPLASPGSGSIPVTLFPNSAVAVVFAYTAVP